MSILIFVLLIFICISLFYFLHKYFSKNEFYLLSIIYAVIAFMMSFKLINIFGVDINMGIIFDSGLVMIVYYFVNKYGRDDSKKVISLIIVTTLSCIIFLLLNCFAISSLYDKMSSLYQIMILDNLPILILYPISLFGTLLLSDYCFEEMKEIKKNRNIKGTLVMIGISFIEIFVFIYFSYAFIIRYDISMHIAISSLLIKTIIMTMYFFVINKLFSVRKVK